MVNPYLTYGSILRGNNYEAPKIVRLQNKVIPILLLLSMTFCFVNALLLNTVCSTWHLKCLLDMKFVTSHGKTYTNAFPLNGLKHWQSIGKALENYVLSC